MIEELKNFLEENVAKSMEVLGGNVAICQIANVKIPMLKNENGAPLPLSGRLVSGGVFYKDTILLPPMAGNIRGVLQNIEDIIKTITENYAYEELFLVVPLIQIRRFIYFEDLLEPESSDVQKTPAH